MSLTEQEKKILNTFTEAFQYITEEEKNNLYYFGLGIIFNRSNRKFSSENNAIFPK